VRWHDHWPREAIPLCLECIRPPDDSSVGDDYSAECGGLGEWWPSEIPGLIQYPVWPQNDTYSFVGAFSEELVADIESVRDYVVDPEDGLIYVDCLARLVVSRIGRWRVCCRCAEILESGTLCEACSRTPHGRTLDLSLPLAGGD
jgi:hypothetical protein